MISLSTQKANLLRTPDSYSPDSSKPLSFAARAEGAEQESPEPSSALLLRFSLAQFPSPLSSSSSSCLRLLLVPLLRFRFAFLRTAFALLLTIRFAPSRTIRLTFRSTLRSCLLTRLGASFRYSSS